MEPSERWTDRLDPKLEALLASSAGIKCPASALAECQSALTIVQDYTPLSDSLEWELSHLYYHERGSSAFTSSNSSIPFLINNNGNLSINAAKLLFSSLSGGVENQLERICVLEIGIGTGLFARFFLDSFKSLCSKHRCDYYERIHYICADRSVKMLRDVESSGVLQNHAEKVDYIEMDASRDDFVAALSLTVVHAVFLNYLLDCLPASILRVEDKGLSQLCVRTCLGRGVDPSHYTDLTVEDVLQIARSKESDAKRKLISLCPFFTMQSIFRPVDNDSVKFIDCALALATENKEHLHSHGAIDCLLRSVELLSDGGFVLINDYGYSESDQADYRELFYEHFSASVAIGVNFDSVKYYIKNNTGLQWLEPNGENGHVYSRLLGKAVCRDAQVTFQNRFGSDEFRWVHEPEIRAIKAQKEGRFEASLSALEEAIRRQPFNWHLLNQISQFLTFKLNDHSAGFDIAKAGIALNPTCSADLWNTIGDCLYGLEKHLEARSAFMRALEIDPTNIRAQYNLAWADARDNDYLSALQRIADALYNDRDGFFRDSLLRKQSEVVCLLSSRSAKETQGLNDHRSHVIENALEDGSRIGVFDI